MIVGVLSDTHDRLDSLKGAVEVFKNNKVELIVHCGDWVSPFTIEYFDFLCYDLKIPIYSVFGNNEGDIRRIIERNSKLKNPIIFTSKQTLEIQFNDKKVIVYHGQDSAITKAVIKSQNYDAFFTGHTHVPINKVEYKTLVLNPGSTSYTANSRIIDSASVAIYDSNTNSANLFFLNKPLNI